MESDSNQDQGTVTKKKNERIIDKYPFLGDIKKRLVSYVNPETKKVYVGHVAMFYKDTKRLRIDWDNGATTFHDFGTEDSKWLFHLVKRDNGELKNE